MCGRPVLHGGGQTRHSWGATAERLAQEGWTACVIDQRGHGDSAWIENGDYAFEDFGADAAAVAYSMRARYGAAPVTIGASLGGIASLLADGAAARKGEPRPFRALILVDITPRVDRQGVEKIQGFMRANAQDGFASVEEAAEAVAGYLPHRPRPRSTEGLKKNLRLRPDGRWRWHWDPRFIEGPRPVGRERPEVTEALVDAARGLVAPTLLVRGGSSELVAEEHVREFLALAPHAAYVDMVAGDANDHFSSAIGEFLHGLPPLASSG